eukprot:TRINITY_DN2049_c0_g1_i9.p1 TRINITY_DN2049_c0_g1~~TRINITY_DN2049_c0_g1_i9.p1  ORF type:complete len:118 (+),score=19.81 TRINITY_DN2049_c0_g1_i9:86-439(+)
MIPKTVSAVAKRFPKLSVVEHKLANPDMNLSELRRKIWEMRAEYWLRKVKDYPKVLDAAKVEAKDFVAKLSNPGEITWGDLAKCGIAGVQVYGCFVLEIGRAVQQECRDRSRMPSSA